MAANQLYTGTWLIEVILKNALFSQRFIIEGSAASDGIYPGEVTTTPVVATGPRWSLRCEWNDNIASGWQPSDMRRTGAEFTTSGGLVNILGADDNVPEARDHDYDDMILRCRHLDPDQPGLPPPGIPDFSTPPDGRIEPCVCPGDPVCPPGHGGLGKGGPGFPGTGGDCGGHGHGGCGTG